MSAATVRLTGPAQAAVEAHGDAVTFHDVYDAVGAAIYHDLADRDRHEVSELATQLRGVRGPVLELAAGSGRLTIPLLVLGLEVVALDLSASMLGLLDSRLEALPPRLTRRCRTVVGDMRSFDLGRTFDAIVLGTTSVSLLDADGRQELFAAVARHLAPGGRFLLSTVQRSAGANGPGEELTGASGRRYTLFEDWSGSRTECTVVIVPTPDTDGRVQVCTSVVTVVPRGTLEAELHQHGLDVLATHELAPAGAGRPAVLLEAGVRP